MAIHDDDIAKARQNIASTIGSFIETRRDGSKYKACCPFHHEKTPSFVINHNDGYYFCFGCGASGDAIDFVMQYTSCTFPEAVEKINGHLSSNPVNTQAQPAPHRQQWIPQIRATLPVREFTHYRLGSPVARWEYKTRSGDTAGFVCRFEFTKDDGTTGKETLPICCATNAETGVTEWRWLGFQKPRTLYGLEKVDVYKKFMLLEGEKTSDAAQDIFKSFGAMSWPGGCNAVGSVDWSPLYGKPVTLWPDNDEQGIAAMRQVYEILAPKGGAIRIVPPPAHMPKGWDLADTMDGFNPHDYAKDNAVPASNYFMEPEPPAAQPDEPVTIAEPAIAEYIPAERPPVAQQQPATLPTYLRCDYDSPLIDFNDKGKPLSTIDNLEEMLRRLGVSVSYNVISKNLDIVIPGAAYSDDNNENACLAWVMSECAKFKYQDKRLGTFLLEIADRNQQNPVQRWIDSKPWDGADRLEQLNGSLGSKNPSLSMLLLRKWMIGAVHAALNPKGIENSSVLVLQGEQYAGKTAWFKSLLGEHVDTFGKEGAIINPNDKDSIIGVVKYWIVELGELDATFRRSDIAALKGFITRNYDELRKPYAVGLSKYPRRTVFFASVNPKTYLHDETGNRRFWTIECTADLNPHHGIDMQQAWSQVKHLYDAGNSWKLTRDEMILLNEHNEDYQSVDPIEDLILLNYDASAGIDRTEKLSASEVLLSIGYDRPSNIQSRSAGTILRKHFGDPKKSDGRQVFVMPKKRISL